MHALAVGEAVADGVVEEMRFKNAKQAQVTCVASALTLSLLSPFSSSVCRPLIHQLHNYFAVHHRPCL
jgi:hypothetical protein